MIDAAERSGAKPVRLVLHRGECGGTDKAGQGEDAFRGELFTTRPDERFGGRGFRIGNRISLEIDDARNVGDHGSDARMGAGKSVGE